MGEKQPANEQQEQYDVWNVASIANDIMIRRSGEPRINKTTGEEYFQVKWSTDDELFDVSLFSSLRYESKHFTIHVRSLTSSDLWQFTIDAQNNKLSFKDISASESHEYKQTDIGKSLEGILLTTTTPEAFRYDDPGGLEKIRQRTFVSQAGHLVLDNLLETNAGKSLFDKLLLSTDSNNFKGIASELNALS